MIKWKKDKERTNVEFFNSTIHATVWQSSAPHLKMVISRSLGTFNNDKHVCRIRVRTKLSRTAAPQVPSRVDLSLTNTQTNERRKVLMNIQRKERANTKKLMMFRKLLFKNTKNDINQYFKRQNKTYRIHISCSCKFSFTVSLITCVVASACVGLLSTKYLILTHEQQERFVFLNQNLDLDKQTLERTNKSKEIREKCARKQKKELI